MTVATVGARKSLVKIKNEVNYYPHQLEGVRRMARMGSLLLADEMGLGKSLQALTVAAIDFEIGAAKRVLIVAPASLKWNWEAELKTYTHFSWVMLDGAPKARCELLQHFQADVLITNYEQIPRHLVEINAMAFDIVIFDEAHYLKNRNAARTRAAHALIAKRFLLLTGSPLLNHVDDLWSLLHRIDPVGYPLYYKFVNRYAVYGGYKDKEIVGVKNVKELTGRVHSVMLRRKKADVLELPEKIHIPIIVELHKEQKKLYNQARDELLIELPDDPDPLEVENALTKFLRLKQICGTTACIPGYPDVSIKLDVAIERIEELIENDEHVVAFTQFREVQRCLNRRMDERGIGYYILNGDVEMRMRLGAVEGWSAAPPSVMSAMLQVAGVGLNMTAASKCIFIDKLFVPALNAQAEDRLHRIGATGESIEIISILCKDTIEDRVEAILKSKAKVFGTVVEESGWRRKLLKTIMAEEGM